MSNQCPYCGSFRNVCVSPVSLRYVCLACEKFFSKDEQHKQSVFDQITQSPEVLAEKLVYFNEDSYFFNSTIIEDESWRIEPEAIAATVAKLKEVAE